MAFEQGIANGNTDLLNKLATFLTTNPDLVAAGQEWEILTGAPPLTFSTVTTTAEYAFKAPGLSGSEEIFLNIFAYEDPVRLIHNWGMTAAFEFNLTNDIISQIGGFPQVFSTHWDGDISYTFTGNGQRTIVVADFDGVNIVSYIGKIIPQAELGTLEYPIFVGANTDNFVERYFDASGTFDISCFMNPGFGCRFYDGAGNWRTVINRGGTNGTAYDPTGNVCMSPTTNYQIDRRTASSWDFGPISPSPDGHYTLLPFEIWTMGNLPSPNRFGWLDGVYWVTGIGLNAGDTITENGVDYLICKNISRTSWEEFCAVRLA